VIDPRAIYTVETARAALGLAKHCLAREIRLRRLRVSKRGGRYYITGQWLMEWLEAGEVRRTRSEQTAAVGESRMPGADGREVGG
jgi:hypothetical protein